LLRFAKEAEKKRSSEEELEISDKEQKRVEIKDLVKKTKFF
jgi:hypothetical protein